MRKTLEPAAPRKGSLTGNSNHGGSQMAGLYDLEETLGKGHYAIVKAAKHVFTGERVAVKVIDKTKLDNIAKNALLKEVVCMKLVQHPNVVKLYEVIDTTTKTYLVLELGHGDLYDMILKQQGGLPEDLAKRYFCQILSAVSYCHKLHVAHRDLKPENVVFFPQDGGIVKLTDFGFSNKFRPGEKLDTSCGSLAYSAPEILLGDAYDAPAVDVWSIGVILFMLVCGRAPFQEANDSETLTMIMDVKYSIPPTVSPECSNLIKRMLVRYPEKRATLAEIEANPWLNRDGYLRRKNTAPLIIAHQLTSDERNSIISRMVSGGIGSREQIVELLGKNSYNHITSTFFLLAEKLLRDRGPLDLDLGDELGGTSTGLTGSLESLTSHDRRKNSGQSDNEELASGEDDSLAPLDLEMPGGSGGRKHKKSRELHSISTTLSELDKSLPIVEEDVTAHSEEEDSAAPLPNAIRRRSHYNHRRVIPQRSTSASCSSSEDESSSDPKKKSLPPQKHKGSGGKGGGNGGGRSNRRSRDDESSDEPSGGLGGGGGGGGGGVWGTSQGTSGVHMIQGSNTRSSSGGGGGGGGEGGNTDGLRSRSRSRTSNNTSESERENEERKTSLQLAYEFATIEIGPEERSPCESPRFEYNEYEDAPDPPPPSSKPPLPPLSSSQSHGSSVAKKGKKLFTWFFLRRKKHAHTESQKEPSSGGGGLSAPTSGIYKTRSCAELKLKNVNGQVTRTSSAGPPGSKPMDFNQNI